MSVEADVAQSIATDVGALTYGTNCRVGPVRPPSDKQNLSGAIPHECVFVHETGGFPKLSYVDGDNKGGLEPITVQVLVRSGVRDYDGGKALADLVLAALDMSPPAGYIECRTSAPRPGFVVEDETGHYLWSINATLTLGV